MDLFEQIRQREEEKIQQKESKLKELRSKVQQKDRQFFLVPPTSAADDSNSDKSILRLLGLSQMGKYFLLRITNYVRTCFKRSKPWVKHVHSLACPIAK